MEFDLTTLIVSGALLAFGAVLAMLGASLWSAHVNRKVTRKRLVLDHPAEREAKKAMSAVEETTAIRRRNAAFVDQASSLVKAGDGTKTKMLRQRLIQAGFIKKSAVGLFLLARLCALGAMVLVPVLTTLFAPGILNGTPFLIAVLVCAFIGYKLPDFVVKRRIAARVEEARVGFPDFLDLMTICSNAGLSMEAALDRVAHDLEPVYPNLSANLRVVCSEMRAGLGLEDALVNLSQRVPLEDIRPFASLLRQSKELGTSLSEGLRVYSEDMRHKRLSAAEAKAHALPAKMSIPVTACILPVVIFVAILPTVIRVFMLE